MGLYNRFILIWPCFVLGEHYWHADEVLYSNWQDMIPQTRSNTLAPSGVQYTGTCSWFRKWVQTSSITLWKKGDYVLECFWSLPPHPHASQTSSILFAGLTSSLINQHCVFTSSLVSHLSLNHHSHVHQKKKHNKSFDHSAFSYTHNTIP